MTDGGRLLGVIHLKDVVKPDIKERFAELRRMGIKTVMITGDNPVTAAAIASEAGVDDFIAEATPEDKLRYIREEQAQGRLIAMCGDGTNDAPALAQADVGVAMQTGTQAAREAGNMVDLDSNPTKLIEVVEIGKQLLMTRGSLTTFSIANDVAKYFAIIPALFVASLPELGALNIMELATPQSAILSAVIFNALIIVALIPLALKGVAYRPIGAAALLRRNLLVYGLGGLVAAVHRHQAHRPRRRRPAASPEGGRTMLQQSSPRPRHAARLHAAHRRRLSAGRSPASRWVMFAGPAQSAASSRRTARWSARASSVRRSRSDALLPPAAVGDQRRRPGRCLEDGRCALQRGGLDRLQPRPDHAEAARPRARASVDELRTEGVSGPIPVDAVTTSASGLDPAHLAGDGAAAGAARRQGPRPARGARARAR